MPLATVDRHDYIRPMLKVPQVDAAAGYEAADPPFEIIPGDPDTGFLILCDHATNIIPAELDGLGLPDGELERHIAYDIGARDVTVELAERLGAPAVMSRFSRLVIDPNRGEDDPTLVMRIADGAIIPGNARLDVSAVEARRSRFHVPYHSAVDATIDAAIAAGTPPAIFSVHSFTPVFKGTSRPWHATVLWDRDPRFPLPLIAALEREGDIVVGENVPYSGRLRGDTLYTHGTLRGLAHVIIELRQDLIATSEGARAWGQRLAGILAKIGESGVLRADAVPA